MKLLNDIVRKIESTQNGNRSNELGIALILPKMLVMALLEIISRGNELLLKRANKQVNGPKTFLAFFYIVIVLAVVNFIGAEIVTITLIAGLLVALVNTITIVKGNKTRQADEIMSGPKTVQMSEEVSEDKKQNEN